MLRIDSTVRPNLDELAKEHGFSFHVIDGEVYWDESRYYQFTLQQIEEHLEDPTDELHQMCLALVDDVVKSDALMDKLAIPEHLRPWIVASWEAEDPSLYGRMDFAYDGKNQPKFLEYNAQTPTSLYEAAYFQWVWLTQLVDKGQLPRSADQFNSIQEKLIMRFAELRQELPEGEPMYFACCKETDEDKGTVDYLRDCCEQAGLPAEFIYVEDIGLAFSPEVCFTDLDHRIIRNLFMLYPWEMAFFDDYGKYLTQVNLHWFEPPWKAILSNKGILPLLWKLFPNHPNLLPAYFEDDEDQPDLGEHFVIKPLFSREGANILIVQDGETVESVDGIYGDGPRIGQKFHPMPKFGDDFTLIGSWVVGNKACGLSIREDNSVITKDTSRFIPHIILG